MKQATSNRRSTSRRQLASALAATAAACALLWPGPASRAQPAPVPIPTSSGAYVASPQLEILCGSYLDLTTTLNPHAVTAMASFQSAIDDPMGFVVASPLTRVPLTRMDNARESPTCLSPGNFPGAGCVESACGYAWATPAGGTGTGVARFVGYINVPDSGAAGGPEDFTFGTIGNDAVRVIIGGVEVARMNYAGPDAPALDWKHTRWVRFAQPGVYSLRIEWTTNHFCGIDPLEVAYVPGLLGSSLADPFDDDGCSRFGGLDVGCTGGPSPTADLDASGSPDGWRILGDPAGVLDILAAPDGGVPATETGDADGDTITDGQEGRYCGTSVNTDAMDDPDYDDDDSDNDLILDRDEAGDTDPATPPRDTDGNGIPDFRQPNGCLTTSSTTCFIGGICMPAGSVNPANSCEECAAGTTRTGWSPRPTGTACEDGLFCTAEDTCTAPRVCTGGPARVCTDGLTCTSRERCDEVEDRCTFDIAVGCLIDFVCRAAMERNPMNRCEVCDPTIASRTTRWTPLGGACDGDMDGYCPGGRDSNMDGDCSDPGEMTSPGDCLDTNAMVNPSRTEVCSNRLDDECDGLVDNDDPDCSDSATRDMDMDGFCPAGTDSNGDRDCRDAGEMTGPQDCLDTDATVNPSVVEQGTSCDDTLDNDCDTLVDGADPGCSGDFDDDDGDGYCERGVDGNGDGDCRDATEDVGPFDCNDMVAAIHPAADEVCDNALDDDCDALVDTDDLLDCSIDPADRDDDRDGYCESGRDGNGDGDCLDEGEPGGAIDCDDTDATVNPGATEDCANGVDDDCDDATDLEDEDCASDDRTDMDGDGFCPMGRDRNDDGDCLDEGEGTADADCDDTMAAVNPDAAEDCDNRIDDDCDDDVDAADSDCLDENLVDMDGDGFCPNGRDTNDDGDCLDEGESGGDGDCNDAVAGVNPSADEICDDTVDNDCDGDLDTDDADCAAGSVDVDADGFCAGGGTDDNTDGDCDDEGEAAGPADCDDSDDTVNPGADEICDDDVDNDCDDDTDADDSDCAAGDAGAPDMGRPDAGRPDMGTVSAGGPAGGSGCSAAGPGDGAPASLLGLLALGLVSLMSRRRRRR